MNLSLINNTRSQDVLTRQNFGYIIFTIIRRPLNWKLSDNSNKEALHDVTVF
jgi:hypothetical protein